MSNNSGGSDAPRTDRRSVLQWVGTTTVGVSVGIGASSTAAGKATSGDVIGTDDATEIQDWHDLDAVRDDLDGEYVLANDLDENTAGYVEHVSDPDGGWEPIGAYAPDAGAAFTGQFDGQGNEIRALTIDRAGELGVGLFGGIERTAAISRVGLVGLAVTGTGWVGGLVGSNEGGNVVESTASGSVTSTDGFGPTGGLVGAVTAGGELRESSADVTVTSDETVGGLVGLIENAETKLVASTARGDVSGGGPAGGVVGNNNGGQVLESSASGAVTGDEMTGGLAGTNSGHIRESAASGDVTADEMVGGLVGRNSFGTVEDSLATGGATGEELVGGFAGWHGGRIEQSWASGTVTGDEAVGGLAGYRADGAELTGSYWDTDATGQDNAIGETEPRATDEIELTGLTTDEMQGEPAIEHMSALNFEERWRVVTDPADYPELRAVADRKEQEATQSQTDDDGLPGFGVVGAAAALVGSGYLSKRLDRNGSADQG